MLKIIMCDDDKFILKLSAERISQEIKKLKLLAEIVCITTDVKEMFNFLEKNPNDYLCFLDLDFGEGHLNGIDIAKKIKKNSKNSKIVFVTNHQEMAMHVLYSGVEPFGFIEKTTDMNLLSNSYRKYIQMAILAINPSKDEQIEKEITLTVGIDEQIKLKVAQITYVETEKMVSHGITYHTLDNSKITVRDTLDNISKVLGDDFLKCHRSILVNKKYMIGIEDNMIRLTNFELIPVSFRMKKEVKKCISN